MEKVGIAFHLEQKAEKIKVIAKKKMVLGLQYSYLKAP